MHSALTYNEMKAKIPEIKHMFQTRHYTQCAIKCERLLTRTNIDDIHPIHQACLNFYFALSHDTMAREATLKNRSSELYLAETHYMAALKALTIPGSKKPKLDDISELQSPTSSISEDEPGSIVRRPSSLSLSSQHSRASSETSYADDEDFFADWEIQTSKDSQQYRHSSSGSAQDDYAETPKIGKRRPSPIITRPTSESIHAEQFSADVYTFATMVEVHLASVRVLKQAATTPTHRHSYSRPLSSIIPSTRVGRDSVLYGDAAGMESLRQNRKSVTVRPRFDASSIQALCQAALSEL